MNLSKRGFPLLQYCIQGKVDHLFFLPFWETSHDYTQVEWMLEDYPPRQPCDMWLSTSTFVLYKYIETYTRRRMGICCFLEILKQVTVDETPICLRSPTCTCNLESSDLTPLPSTNGIFGIFGYDLNAHLSTVNHSFSSSFFWEVNQCWISNFTIWTLPLSSC